MNNLSNEQYEKFIYTMDSNTIQSVLFIINEDLNRFNAKFLACANEKEMFILQGENKSLSEIKRKLEKILLQKQKTFEELQNRG